MRRRVFSWEVVGFFFIVIAGVLLHFVFEWSNYSPTVAIFSAVNESVWEHLKLAFWPSILFAIIEMPFVVNASKNYILAKAVSFFTSIIIIMIVFFTYTGIIGYSILAVDITSFVIAVLIAQILGYRILTSRNRYSGMNIFAVIPILLLLFAFIYFTFYPPQINLFKDSVTNMYGIPKR